MVNKDKTITKEEIEKTIKVDSEIKEDTKTETIKELVENKTDSTKIERFDLDFIAEPIDHTRESIVELVDSMGKVYTAKFKNSKIKYSNKKETTQLDVRENKTVKDSAVVGQSVLKQVNQIVKEQRKAENKTNKKEVKAEPSTKGVIMQSLIVLVVIVVIGFAYKKLKSKFI